VEKPCRNPSAQAAPGCEIPSLAAAEPTVLEPCSESPSLRISVPPKQRYDSSTTKHSDFTRPSGTSPYFLNNKAQDAPAPISQEDSSRKPRCMRKNLYKIERFFILGQAGKTKEFFRNGSCCVNMQSAF
jgi:hypothetical protein